MLNKMMLDRRTLAQLLQNNQQAIVTFERVLSEVGLTLPATIEEAHALAGQALAVAQGALASMAVLAEVVAQSEAMPAAVPFVDQDDMLPAAPPQVDHDDTVPRTHLGTISSQNADAVEITGGRAGLDAGALATPSFYLGGDSSTGLYRPAANKVGVAIAGVRLLELSSLLADLAGDLTVSGSGTFGKTGTAGQVRLRRASDGAPVGTDTMVGNVREIDNQAGDIVLKTGSAERARASSTGLGVTGALSSSGAFGCNGKTAQASAALGAAATDLASAITLVNNIRQTLIANGIGS